jgi:hypothetical protein
MIDRNEAENILLTIANEYFNSSTDAQDPSLNDAKEWFIFFNILVSFFLSFCYSY